MRTHRYAPRVARYGFGCMGITALYGPPMADEDALALLKGVYPAAGCLGSLTGSDR